MKNVSYIALALGAGLLLATPATAADIYTNNGSFKDEGGAVSPARSGFLIGGVLGYAWGDRDITHTITRERGTWRTQKWIGEHGKVPFAAPTEAEYTKDDGTVDTEAFEDAKEAHAEVMKYVDGVLAEDPTAHFDGTTLFRPKHFDTLTNKGSDDFGSFVYGAELSYLMPLGTRFSLEPVIGVLGYSGNKSTISHTEALATDSEGNPTDRGTQTGEASAERNYDIDLLLRLHLNVRPDTTVFVGGGLSFANATVCGKNSSDRLRNDQAFENAKFNTAHCDDDMSTGFIGQVGATHWLNNSWRLGVVGDWKHHEFESSGNSFASKPYWEDGHKGEYGLSNSSVKVEDDVFTIKGTVSYFFN